MKYSANTKLLLFGEHAAVYGYPAVGIPLPWTVTVSISASNEMESDIPTLNDILFKVFPQLHAMPPFKIEVRGDAPIGSGLGSSGALCVALTRCLLDYSSIKIENEDERLLTIWKLSHELEKIFHRTPSGIDTGLSCYAKTCFFKGKNGELPNIFPIKAHKLPLIIGVLPRKSNTAELISQLRKQKEQNNYVESHIQELGNIANQAIDLLTSIQLNLLSLGNLANGAHQILSELNLSTNELDSMINKGIACGALGGKLSGAGGGGCYYLLANNNLDAERIVKELSHFSLEQKITHILYPTLLK